MSFSCKTVLVFLSYKSLSTYSNAQTLLGTRSVCLGSRGELTLHAPSPAWSTKCALSFSHFSPLMRVIHQVGLLPASNHQQVPFAYKMYSRNDKICVKSRDFKNTFSMDVEIDFIGVW